MAESVRGGWMPGGADAWRGRSLAVGEGMCGVCGECGVAALLLPVGVITVAVLVIVMAVSGLTAQHILLHSSPKEGARHE